MNEILATETPAKDLDQILQPLFDLLTEKFSDSLHYNGLAEFMVGGAHGFALWGDADGRLVELPDRLRDYPDLSRALATLLHRTGTSFGADENSPVDEDPCRGPLRFSVVKKALWDNECAQFLTGTHLLIEHFDYDSIAAERQVALLVEHLGDDANLVELSPDDLAMF